MPTSLLLLLSIFLIYFFIRVFTEAWKCDFFARHSDCDRHIVVLAHQWDVYGLVSSKDTSYYAHPVTLMHTHHAVISTDTSSSYYHHLVSSSLNGRTHLYNPQTKILEGRTNISECVFEALFKGVSTRFGLRNVEKCLPGKRTLKCLSYLPKSSFGRGNFKRRFWKSDPTFQSAFSKRFPRVWEHKRFEMVRNGSKMHSERLVRASKIFVCGAYSCVR